MARLINVLGWERVERYAVGNSFSPVKQIVVSNGGRERNMAEVATMISALVSVTEAVPVR
jgi:hypothetical protein